MQSRSKSCLQTIEILEADLTKKKPFIQTESVLGHEGGQISLEGDLLKHRLLVKREI